MQQIRTIGHDFSKRPKQSRPFSGKDGSKKSLSKNTRRQVGEKIDVNRFIQKPQNIEAPTIEIKHKFEDFLISPEIKKNLSSRNYVTPTPIQDQSIPYILEGRDIIGLANTGTGKTAAFLLPMITKAKHLPRERFLIIAPTRELAVQIEKELLVFSAGMRIFSAICVGGMPIYNQIQKLKRAPQFVIGTPGRIKDLNKRGLIKFETFGNIILDEVDRMLDMGFVDEIREILSHLPQKRQSLFFSATMPPKIRDLVNTFTTNPITIEISSGKTAQNIEQDVVRVEKKGMKFFQLIELLNEPELSKVLIFSETKREVEGLATSLVKEGFKADAIHGDKRQSQRDRSLNLFKKSQVDILVATDVAARGLDIKDVTHVINYTIPKSYDDYIHRIGRTGRGASTGKALTFVENYRY